MLIVVLYAALETFENVSVQESFKVWTKPGLSFKTREVRIHLHMWTLRTLTSIVFGKTQSAVWIQVRSCIGSSALTINGARKPYMEALCFKHFCLVCSMFV